MTTETGPEALPRAAPEEGKHARPPLDAQGMERPRFLLDFPFDPELEELIAAFEAGNYARVRRDAEAVAARAADPHVRDAALELRRRIEPDPLAKYLVVLSVLLLAFLTMWAYAEAGH